MLLLLTHLVATCFMTGVIWIIQVVHYPLFEKVGALGYSEYQEAHMKRITWIVMPIMLIELVSGVLLSVFTIDGRGLSDLDGIPEQLLWANLIGLGLIWASTILIQVPAHMTLRNRFENSAYQRLVRTNWIRTILWSIRLMLVFYLVVSSLSLFSA